MGLLKNTFRTLLLAALASVPFTATADQPYHPFAEPLIQDPDWQYFSSVDIQQLEDLQMRQKAPYGWYLTYDRLHVHLDRPIIEPESSKFDDGWGNRWTFGVMDDSDKGWDFQFHHVTGPNAYVVTRYPRLLVPAIPATGVINLRFPLPGERYPFDPGFGDGVFEVRDSLNVASMGSFEVNRTWRTEPYMYGGFLEPLVGLRYIDFTDYNVADGYSGFAIGDDDFERFDVSNIITKNRMLVAQFGFRYFKDVSRFRFSSEFKAFGGGNWQTGSVLTQQYTFGEPVLSGPTILVEPTTVLTEAPGLKDKAVPGLDFRVDAAWKATRQISLRAGAGIFYIGQGIARGSQIPDPFSPFAKPPAFGPSASFVQQNLVMPFVNLGMTINR